ncbi:hypothetical protein DRP53_06785 [candidate division WOR-3 bacterium]|uniref:Uncharacterized protein n=1 Tax=candidate division WOR-3 bacterium TaxID=2052148 RepID=A0A660SGR6_UNCW3|nr:MAG: hypothetical protein DRP53_06785 [candidate division WOR-3 bacterium]
MGFKPPPYSYCDYRCDRCSERDRCAVYREDQERLLQHYLKGEDPDDPEVFTRDLEEIFQRTEAMIREWAEKEGIDIDELDDEEYPKVNPNDFVIYRLAREYFQAAHRFIQTLEREGIPAEVADDYEDLIWYHTLIYAKTGRLVSGTHDMMDEEWRRIEERGTLGVIQKGIRLSRSALEHMFNELPGHLESIAGLLKILNRIERQIETDLYQRAD